VNVGLIIFQSVTSLEIFIFFFKESLGCPETSQSLQRRRVLPNAVFGLRVHKKYGKYFISDAGIFALALTALHVSDERPCINMVFPSVLIAL